MTLFRNATLLINGIMIAGMLGACQHENDMVPMSQSAATITDRNAKSSNLPLMVKDGNDVIEYAYSGMGRPLLKKVTLPSKGKYFTYTHGYQQITAVEYHAATNTPLAQYQYKLDANGRCVEATIGSVVFIYEYNADGQLTKMYKKNQVNERTEFLYSPDNAGGNVKSLATIKIYDQSGTLTKTVNYDYDLPNRITWPDLNPLNPEYMTATTRYLTIFGRFATNLPLLVSEGSGYGQTFGLSYSMNAGGYPVKVQKAAPDGTNPVITERKYISPLAI